MIAMLGLRGYFECVLSGPRRSAAVAWNPTGRAFGGWMLLPDGGPPDQGWWQSMTMSLGVNAYTCSMAVRQEPPFVSSVAVNVATSTMTTAPGQIRRSDGVGPIPG